MNAVEIEEAVSDLAAAPFDAREFPFDFLTAFDNKAVTVQRLRAGSGNASDVSGGVLQRNNIHMAVCAEGRVSETVSALRASPKTAANKVKFILATDGVILEAEELASGDTLACDYPQFAEHFGFFLPLAGISAVAQIKDNPVDIKATGRLNKLYIELLKVNKDWATPERRHDLNHFMARLIFCMFAEDTGIFLGNRSFSATVERMSESQSSNTHEVIAELFRAMNTKIENRAAGNFRPWADALPYVNGGLFSGSAECPRFSQIARSYLLRAAALDWTKINPDIFGSMIQAVADDNERGALGMHYTSVPNILKVLNPLFLDDLREQLKEAGNNPRSLLNLRKRMAKIRVFDPACGSGNFLVIAYKQMREIEAEINRRRGEADQCSDIPLTNFRGIELRDFPAEIARLALIIAEYQCDVLYRGQQEALAEFLPLDTQNWITCGNALRLDWLSMCPPTGTGVKLHADDLFDTPLDQAQIDFENEGGETYICGNPPYVGSSKQTSAQKEDMRRLFEGGGTKYKNLDYIACWFSLAAHFCRSTRGAAAFVTTNSICQGEQVYLLWPNLLRSDIEIFFAQSSFKWNNLAKNIAGVTCVVVGIRSVCSGKKYIFSGDLKREVFRINPYLIDFEDIFVPRHAASISNLPKMLKGNQPTDGGNLILMPWERRYLLHLHPSAVPFIRKLYGAKELIDGLERYCLWIEDDLVEDAEKFGEIRRRISAAKVSRLESPAKSTRDRAADSHRFIQIQDFGKRAIVVPEVSSEKRQYLPCGIIDDRSIATNKLFTIYDPPQYVFSICSSRLHRIWAEAICGKLEERISYSNVLGYNTFPVPPLTDRNKADLTRSGQDILLAREAHYPKTIADLYDSEAMPEDLRHAHDRNDETLERIYIGRTFRNDTERLEKLFGLYTKMTGAALKRKGTV